MSPDTPIEQDLPCIFCGYNLRGLTVTHRCPECELPALRSYLVALSGGQRWRRMADGTVVLNARKAMEVLTALLGCEANAIRFVGRCIHHASEERTGSSNVKLVVSAKDLCAAIREFALTYFGSVTDARAGLRNLGLTRSEDVGRIVAALVEAGMVSASEGESPSELKGVFTLDTLFPDATEYD